MNSVACPCGESRIWTACAGVRTVFVTGPLSDRMPGTQAKPIDGECHVWCTWCGRAYRARDDGNVEARAVARDGRR